MTPRSARDKATLWASIAWLTLVCSSAAQAQEPIAAPEQAAPETPAPAVVDVATVTATTGAIESALEISGTLTPLSRVAGIGLGIAAQHQAPAAQRVGAAHGSPPVSRRRALRYGHGSP